MTGTHPASGAATVVLLAALLLYAAPVVVAAVRGSADLRRVVRWDVGFGWTGIGWLAALTLAVASPPRR